MVEFNIGHEHICGEVGTIFYAPIPKEVHTITIKEGVELLVMATGKTNRFGENAFRIINITDFNEVVNDEPEATPVVPEVVEETTTEPEAVDNAKAEEEIQADKVDFSEMTKKELIAYIQENKLDIDTKQSKTKLLEKLAEV